MLLYMKLAKRYDIIDVPNHRSSHTEIVVRGGGVIFVLAILVAEIYGGLESPYFILGLLFLSLISFLDDINPLPNRLRILTHFVVAFLLVVQIQLLFLSWWIMVPVIVVMVGAMNAYNFMDGINGITMLYSLVAMLTMLFIQLFYVQFTNEELLILTVCSLVIFAYFNFRKDAICFAGDIGSFSIAYLLIFLLLGLIKITSNYALILLLSVYGVDSVLTIILRMIRKENIFRAHRSHLYQFLVNKRKLSHLRVAAYYALLQAFINVLLLCNLRYEWVSSGVLFVVVISSLCAIYLVLVPKLTGEPIFKRA